MFHEQSDKLIKMAHNTLVLISNQSEEEVNASLQQKPAHISPSLGLVQDVVEGLAHSKITIYSFM